MLTVSALGRRHGLSRSTLLYYDRIGLLRPSGRTAAGYRVYTEADERRLAAICVYRQADVPLDTISSLLDQPAPMSARAALSAHLAELGRRLEVLRAQQARVLRLIGSPAIPDEPKRLSASEMTQILRGAGLDDDGLDRLHAVFEQTDPKAHEAFLAALGLAPADRRAIRTRALNHAKPDSDASEDRSEES